MRSRRGQLRAIATNWRTKPTKPFAQAADLSCRETLGGLRESYVSGLVGFADVLKQSILPDRHWVRLTELRFESIELLRELLWRGG